MMIMQKFPVNCALLCIKGNARVFGREALKDDKSIGDCKKSPEKKPGNRIGSTGSPDINSWQSLTLASARMLPWVAMGSAGNHPMEIRWR